MAEDDLGVGDAHVIPGAELSWTFSPSGGPGGQHANRSATRAELRYDLDGSVAFDAAEKARIAARLGSRVSDGAITVAADDTRSQWRNRALARRRLAELLRTGLEMPRSRRPTRPSAAARRRRIAAKRARSEKKRLRRRPRMDD